MTGERPSLHRREFLRAVASLTLTIAVAPLVVVEAIAQEPISLVPGVLGLVWGPIVVAPGARVRVAATAPRAFRLVSIQSEADGLILEGVMGWRGHGLPISAYRPHGICFSEGYPNGLPIGRGREIEIRLYNPQRFPQSFLAAAL